MIRRTISIDGKEVVFKASAAIPRLYRGAFNRDIFSDLSKMQASVSKGSDVPIEDLEVFENVAYIMAKHADPTVPDTIEDWLDNFNTFSIYQVLPEILQMWGLNTQTTSVSKKK